MERAVDRARGKKGKVKLLSETNEVRKHEGVMAPRESLGQNGRKLASCRHAAE